MIVAPHPDDEVLGCGGLLTGHALHNGKVDVLFLTEGNASHKDCCTVPAGHIGLHRRRLAVSANKLLNIPDDCLHFLTGKDGELQRNSQNGFSDLAENIAVNLEESEPNVVFCPHPFEGWSDHIAAGELTRAAIEMLPPDSRPRLYYYCVWFWYSMPLTRAWHIDWRKARILDISADLLLKQKAMSIYMDALAPCGNPWVGKLPYQLLRAFEWNKELFFEADIRPQKLTEHR